MEYLQRDSFGGYQYDEGSYVEWHPASYICADAGEKHDRCVPVAGKDRWIEPTRRVATVLKLYPLVT